MRFGMRMGSGSWVTGGGGVLATSAFLGLLHLAALLSAWVVFTSLGLLLGLLAYALRNTKSARRAQLAGLLKDKLDEAALGALDGRTKAWAVYAVGEQFHHGVHPKKGEELLRLYPDRAAHVARVALFADATRARSAAGQLQGLGYSCAELLSLFQKSLTPNQGPLAAPPARSVAPTVVNSTEQQMSTQKDTTQYTFDGQTTGKARLVLALVKRHVREKPGLAFQDLRSAFPDELQAESPIQFARERGVVARLDDLSGVARKRFFVGDGETIDLSDGVVVVSREWNLFNIQSLLRRAKELGYAVAVVPSGR